MRGWYFQQLTMTVTIHVSSMRINTNNLIPTVKMNEL